MLLFKRVNGISSGGAFQFDCGGLVKDAVFSSPHLFFKNIQPDLQKLSVFVFKGDRQKIIGQVLGGIQVFRHFRHTVHMLDGLFAPALCRNDLLPFFDEFEDGGVNGEECLRKVDHRLPDRVKPLMDGLFYLPTVVRSRGISDIVDAVSSRPADDLLDFPIGEGTPFKAVIFYGLHQDDTSDGKVHAHADGICGDHHIGLARSEKLRLFVPHVIGKSAVDNAAADVFFPELGRHGVDISP